MVKKIENANLKPDLMDKVLSKIAIGALITSISLGTLGAISDYTKKKNSGRTIDKDLMVEKYSLSGTIELSDSDEDVVLKSENVNYNKLFDYTGVTFDDDKMDYGFMFKDFFMQRPDLSVLYSQILKKVSELGNIINNSSDVDEELLEQRESLISKRNEIVMMAYNYLANLDSLNKLKVELNKFKTNNSRMEKQLDSASDVYSAKLLYMNDTKIEELEEQVISLENELYNCINSSITVDDIKFLWNGYNSAYGYVPAGEWDTWLNPNYSGEGHLTGLRGSFQGIQGIETGYDSRKGAEKLNYGDPDRALLKLLAQVTDKDGNILYPMESFEKGGKYYYHIFGINDDGTINYDLIDNPRFGLKMLGDYFIVGGDQRLLRERGSFVLTTLGPAIIIDNGEIPDLEVDPNHIDMSMDEVLFWLKNYSHNSDLKINSMAGIYDWCTPENFDGVVDVSYEIMERNYVNNLNVQYDLNLICFFDRDEFFTETNYNGQNHFVLTLNR